MKLRIGALLALTAISSASAPILAQSYDDEQRWAYAQRRYDAETQRYQAERDRYFAIRDAARRLPPPPPPPPPPPLYGDRYEGGYDPSVHYRDDPRYSERVLTPEERVYRGMDGRYYCKRNDGTTGLIVGAVGGGVLGNAIDGGHSRAAGTLLGAAIGALAGKAIDQNNSIRCR